MQRRRALWQGGIGLTHPSETGGVAVFAHIGGAGLIEGCAGKLLRQRKALGCEHIRVFADVKKKHCSHAITGDLDIVDEVKQAEFFLVDGVIVTGVRTTEPPSASELRRVKKKASVPVIVGSGMTAKNIRNYFALADGFIVGSTFRKKGRFLSELEPERLAAFLKVFRGLRGDVSRKRHWTMERESVKSQPRYEK